MSSDGYTREKLETDTAFRKLTAPVEPDAAIKKAQHLGADDMISVYVRRINEVLDEYTDKYFSDGYKKQSQWNSALSYARRVLFPPAFMARSLRGEALDLNNLLLLYAVFYAYQERTMRAGMAVSAYGFSCLTGIHNDTVKAWLTSEQGESWVAILPNGHYLRGTIDQDPPAGADVYTYRQLASDIILSGKESVRHNLMDSPVGTIALANHDTEVGLNYEKQTIEDRADAWESSRSSVSARRLMDLTRSEKNRQLLDDLRGDW